MRTALDDAAFVFGNRAEGTATKTTAHDVDGETNHFPSRDVGIAVARVWIACVGQAKHIVHFFGGEGNRRRIEPHIALTVHLHQGAGIARVGFQVQSAAGMGIEHRVVSHGFKAWDAHHLLVTRLATGFGALFCGHEQHRFGVFFHLFVTGSQFFWAVFHVRAEQGIHFAWHVYRGGIDFCPLLVIWGFAVLD